LDNNSHLSGLRLAKRRHFLVIGALVLTIFVSLLASPFLQSSPVAPIPRTTLLGAPSGTYFDHVVVIVMEDQGINAICGPGTPPPCKGSNSPFLSNLANTYGISYNYTSLDNFSEPNYLAMIGGQLFGCANSACPSNINATNLVDRLDNAHLTWKAFMENQSPATGCDTGTQEPYQHEHNPFVAFQDIVSNQTRCNNIVLANPSNCSVTDCALIDTLNSASAPNFMWLTPNDCNNMHSNSTCTANGCTVPNSSTCIADGDSYLSSLVPSILNSYTFQTQRSALFITFDEGSGFCPTPPAGRSCVYDVWAGPQTVRLDSSAIYSHYSFLRTVEVNWGLANLTNNDVSAQPMTEFFNIGKPLPTQQSWNPKVSCTPTVVTIEQLLGNVSNSNGGAQEVGSIYSPGLTNSSWNPDQVKSWLTLTGASLSDNEFSRASVNFCSDQWHRKKFRDGGGHKHNLPTHKRKQHLHQWPTEGCSIQHSHSRLWQPDKQLRIRHHIGLHAHTPSSH
jgi:phosphatidylinositol-3-phosphatase